MSIHINQLSKETSPYLLQHATNPVHWQAWNDDTLSLAKSEGKMLLISIGYATCHWCHVMEKECFENELVAKVMNEHFICIKIDREERPDVDQLYMDALQLMTGQGGWPLNIVALPDGKPIWGGTYFPQKKWIEALYKIADLYKNQIDKVTEYAVNLTNGIKQLSLVPNEKNTVPYSLPELEAAFFTLEKHFDVIDGGMDRVPKFPMPDNYTFLLNYNALTNTKSAYEQVELTLTKMALGGIYDQLAGGFSRYSVDGLWKVPHFEKMLYDNALLLGLYADAYRANKKSLYKNIIEQTINWLQTEMRHSLPAYFSGIDADSEGVEGKFYVWTKDDFLEVITEDKFLLYSYWQLEEKGAWEDGNNILMPIDDVHEFCVEHNITEEELAHKVASAKQKLLAKRNLRPRPSLDDKVLLSWNALLIKAYCKCYQALNDESVLLEAEAMAAFIQKNMQNNKQELLRTWKNGQAKIDAFLEDYAYYIDALIILFETTGKVGYLDQANSLIKQVEDNFSTKENALFYFSKSSNSSLVATKIDYQDNVMPSANSVMAHNYFMLGKILSNNNYLQKSKLMLDVVLMSAKKNPGFYSNWLSLYAKFISNFTELVIIGPKHLEAAKEQWKQFLPFQILIHNTNDIGIELTKNRESAVVTMIYKCANGSCSLPIKYD